MYLVPLQREVEAGQKFLSLRSFLLGAIFLTTLEIIGKTQRKFPSRKARLSPLLEHELACNRLNMPFHVERAKNANSFLPITVAIPPLINCTCFQVINNGLRSDTDSCDGLTNGESRVIDASPLPSLFFSFVIVYSDRVFTLVKNPNWL